MRLYFAFRIAFLLSLEKVSALYFASRGHIDALLLLVIYDSIGIKGKGCIFCSEPTPHSNHVQRTKKTLSYLYFSDLI